MDIFAEVLATISNVVKMLKEFFEGILATLKGEDKDAETDEGAEA